jgi:hypothetical protein
MASGTGIVIVQPQDLVEEQEPPKSSHFWIDWTSEARFQRCFDFACETRITQNPGEALVQSAGVVPLSLGALYIQRNGAHKETNTCEEQKQPHDLLFSREKSDLGFHFLSFSS